MLTEEAADVPFSQLFNWRQYWLVDPLDGTGEFIAGSGDFATLIALVRDNVPVLGVIYAPESDVLYWAVRGHGAFKEVNGETLPISAMHHEHDQPDSLVVAISRRQKLENLTRRLNPAIDYKLIPLGSSCPQVLPGGGRGRRLLCATRPHRRVGYRRCPVHRRGGRWSYPQPGVATAQLQRNRVAGEPGLHSDGRSGSRLGHYPRSLSCLTFHCKTQSGDLMVA